MSDCHAIKSLKSSSNLSATVLNRTFCMSRVPFAFEFESKRPNSNLATKQLPNYHSSDLEKSVYWLNGNSANVLSLNCHSAITVVDLRGR